LKTTFPINLLSRPPRRCRALTILEMLVSTALLSFIVLGLTAMFIQTQKAFKTGIKQATVTDAGRAIIDMIAADFSQMANGQLTNQTAVNSGIFNYPNMDWYRVLGYDLVQSQNGVPFRTNELEDIFAMVQTNNNWLGVGYSVSNWFTSGGAAIPGVGTLYRYTTNVTGPLTTSNANFLYPNFYSAVSTGTFTNFHRIADGVVHLKIYAYDTNGYENQNEVPYDYGAVTTNLEYPNLVWVINPLNPLGPPIQQTNFVPHSIDIELGILEPEAFEHARALFTSGATTAAEQYLASAAGQVEIFRQHIIISAGAP
jgi:hypothetical protein